MVWSRFDDDVEWVFAENMLDGLVSCSTDPYPLLLRSLSQYAPRLTVLDLHCNCGPGIDQIPSELRRFRGLKELSLRDFPDDLFDEYVEATTTVLINSPELETLRIMALDGGLDWARDPCYESQGHCMCGLLPLICEKFAGRGRKEGSVDGNKRADIPRLKLREVAVDHHSMNRFILDLPDPDPDPSEDPSHHTSNNQKPLYLEKLTDLQYLERLHVEMAPEWSHAERLDLIRLPNLTPDIAPRLQSMTISPPCAQESYRWQDWAIENNFVEYACQVSLGRLDNVTESSGPVHLVFDWTSLDVAINERLSTLFGLLKDTAVTKSLERLEIVAPGDWVKLIPSLKDTLSHLGKLKYFRCHMAEFCPPLCLSWEAVKRDKTFRKMMDLAEDFFEVQPSLLFLEVNSFLYQVVRWGPGARDFHMVEILDREREWVAPGDSPWQGPDNNAVPSRMLV
ncbi:unnamed protein product [Sordaria macrospora k-hell]|uniref:WGS project CABT00000000 data, contig 2.13 n=2 Tax=Sordaria macrospora TaxID=5147 RepID=F7VY98_SORMK|nr:uncharacterized protein SMAC_06667 [Sordaria macrospora k-hell]CCC10492.1 unnamed protein product [Sordaria macrospora k-hell]